jgi:hypothetical protein
MDLVSFAERAAVLVKAPLLAPADLLPLFEEPRAASVA